ncbi:MAG TPA: NAD(P)/FAD-dependent oxidoreductase [Acidimicrobiales bacterium]|nr:NAD(P)/FAD-dependent oxidoreductase [Acidimicrobiales bacterium]
MPDAADADAVVIGSGPNGMVAANLLADEGWTVTVLEAAPTPGGAVRTEELTVPGFHHDVFSAFYPLAAVSPALQRLQLEDHGLRWRHAPLTLAHPLPEGRAAAIFPDLDATAASLDALCPGDGAGWLDMIGRWDAVSGPLIGAIMGTFPPVGPALRLFGRLGPTGLLRLGRHALLPVRRMGEELFSGPGPRLLLGGCALHADLGPEAAGSGMYGWLLACLAQRQGFPVPEGGAGALIAALVDRLRSRGGTLACGTEVTRVVVRHGRAVGVETRDGGAVTARRAVIADVAAPALYLELVGAEHLPPSLLADLRHFQWDTATVKVDWALSGPIPWAAPEARRAGTVHVADDFDNLTAYAAQLAMGQLPDRPFLLVGQQSMADPGRSPAGTETAWAYTHVPRRLVADAAGQLAVPPAAASGSPASAGSSAWLPGFVARIEARLEALAPGFSDRIIGRSVLGPGDLQDRNANLHGGAIGGGTAQLHQQLVLRPVPGSGRPETPVAGLYLASSSAHPGAGVHGAAGANAARAAVLPLGRARAALLGRGLQSRRSGPGGGPHRGGWADPVPVTAGGARPAPVAPER